ncbi:MAG: hypothetical protein AAFO94_08140 [Bacteroidota bacterium]
MAEAIVMVGGAVHEKESVSLIAARENDLLYQVKFPRIEAAGLGFVHALYRGD